MSIYNNAFGHEEVFFKNIPGFGKRIEIDRALTSPKGTSSKRFYGPGIGHALAMLLTGELQLQRDATETVVCAQYQSPSQGTMRINGVRPRGQDVVLWQDASGKDFEHRAASSAVQMVSALAWPDVFPDTYAKLQAVTNITGFPIHAGDLRKMAAQNPAFKDAVYSFVDHLYVEGSQAVANGLVRVEQADIVGSELPLSLMVGDIKKMLGLWEQSSESGESVISKLTRLARRGGAALIVGPPSTFKTTAVRQLALNLNAHIVEMRGSPGTEDRDLFGAVIPTEHGPQWVDGPLPRAFALAREKTTIALVDEVLRFLPETTNVFVTIINELSYADCVQLIRPALNAVQLPDELLGGVPQSEIAGIRETYIETLLADHLPEKGERYYMLSLPTGQTMFAMKRRLTFCMTTNWGEDHIQVASSLDGALESRIEMTIDVLRAPREIVVPIYEELAGPYPDLASFANDIEESTFNEMNVSEGLFRRPLDPRKCFAFIKDARMCIDDGMTFRSAVLAASENTLIPHVCPREENGNLSASAAERMREIIIKEVLPGLGA